MAGLFGGSSPPIPQVAVAPPMPDPNSPSVIEAQNQAAVSAMQRQGRSSTILGKQGVAQGAQPGKPTPADAYTGTKLGSQ